MTQKFTNLKLQKLLNKNLPHFHNNILIDLLIYAIIKPLFDFSLLHAAFTTSEPVAVLCINMLSVCEPLTSC